MEPAALIFAAASLPILAFHIWWYRSERALESIYGVFAGLFAFSGALLVSYGFPGYLIMPLTFAILGLGSIHAFMKEPSRGKLSRGALYILIAAVILTLEVFL